MLRRPPGEIRAQLPYRVNRSSRAVIRGLSSSANRQIAKFEKKTGSTRGRGLRLPRLGGNPASHLARTVNDPLAPAGPALVAQADPHVTRTAYGPVS